MIYNSKGEIIKVDKQTLEHYHRVWTDPNTPITKEDIRMLDKEIPDSYIIAINNE